MNDDPKTARRAERAARLRREAANCVTTALAMRDGRHAAVLIDEAVRLARRSGELGGAPERKPGH